jgi:hypothetical protein
VVTTTPFTTVATKVPLATPDTLEEAVMFATPVVVAVAIGTCTEAWPCGIVTFAGTEAMVGLSDLSVTASPPPGADPDRFKVMFCVVFVARVKAAGEKLRFSET